MGALEDASSMGCQKVRIPPLALDRLPGARYERAKPKGPQIAAPIDMAWPINFGQVVDSLPQQPGPQPCPQTTQARVQTLQPRLQGTVSPAVTMTPSALSVAFAYSCTAPPVKAPYLSSPKRLGRRTHLNGQGSLLGCEALQDGRSSSRVTPAPTPDALLSECQRSSAWSTAFKSQLQEAEEAARMSGRSLDFLAKLELVEQFEQKQATLRQSSTATAHVHCLSTLA